MVNVNDYQRVATLFCNLRVGDVFVWLTGTLSGDVGVWHLMRIEDDKARCRKVGIAMDARRVPKDCRDMVIRINDDQVQQLRRL